MEQTPQPAETITEEQALDAFADNKCPRCQASLMACFDFDETGHHVYFMCEGPEQHTYSAGYDREDGMHFPLWEAE